MSLINKFLNTIKDIQDNDKNNLDILFSLSEKSLLVLGVVAIFISIIFFESLGYPIIIWSGILIFVGVLRLALAYVYRIHNSYVSFKTWYQLFIVFTLLTAVIFGSLSVLFLAQLDDYHQLFIILILTGMSAGATKTLMLDIRIAISYLLLMLVPIFFNTLTHAFYIDILLIVYILSQIMIAFDSYSVAKSLIDTEINLAKVKDRLSIRENMMYGFLEKAPVPIFSYAMDLQLANYNPAFAKLFSRTENSEPLNLNSLSNEYIVQLFHSSLLDGSQHYNGEYTTILGDTIWIDVVLFPFMDANGTIVGGMGIIKDETKEHNALEKLEYLSIRDSLTGLLNRRGYAEYIDDIVTDSKHNEYYSVLLYIDLNDFKSINDSLGHEVGDKVLLETAERLLSFIDETHMVSRLGGDEFIILMPYMSKRKDELKIMLSKYIENIQKVFDKTFIINSLHLHIQASIGIVIMEPSFDNIEEILRHADMSMYHAKNTKDSISYYDLEMDKKQKDKFKLQNKLFLAVELDQLNLFLQPIVNIYDDSLYSAEILLRWEHPEKGLLSPNEFIDIAIKAGYLSEMTWWIIEKIFRQISQWKNNGQWKVKYMSININAQQLIEKNFASKFMEKLKSYHLKAEDIVIEITERSLIENFIHTQHTIQLLQKVGIKFAIDDFGTGYSSLSYLKKLSFDILKIDREFIKDIELKPKDLLLVSTILDIGKQFDYDIVIEGIEDKKQKDLLHGLDKKLKYQGYYFSKPMPMDAFTQKYLS